MFITAVKPAANGFVTAYPCNTDPPTASTLNHTTNTTIANGASSNRVDIVILGDGYTSDEFGTLEVGKLGDVLVVDGDVLADIEILERRDRILAVMQAGIVKAGRLAPPYRTEVIAQG